MSGEEDSYQAEGVSFFREMLYSLIQWTLEFEIGKWQSIKMYSIGSFTSIYPDARKIFKKGNSVDIL